MAKLNVNLTWFFYEFGKWGWNASTMGEALQKWQRDNEDLLSFSLQVETDEDIEKYRKFIDKKRISWFVPRQAQKFELIDTLIALHPQAFILQVENDLPQNQHRLQLDSLAQIALRAKAKQIATQVMITPLPYQAKEVGELGVELIWLEAVALETEEDINRYATCARVAVDLGVKIGIGPGFTLKQLNWIFKKVPHIDALMVGRQFFAESFYEGVTANLQTYLKQIRNY